MKNRAKLVVSIIALLMILVFIIIGLIIVFFPYKFKWNNVINLDYVPDDVTLRLEAYINNGASFIAEAENGEWDKDVWRIDDSATQFKAENDNTIIISLSFQNKSTSALLITISGIIEDYEYPDNKRFITTAHVNNERQLLNPEPNQTFTLSDVYLPASENPSEDMSTVLVDLQYNLRRKNIPISGLTQNIIITIKAV